MRRTFKFSLWLVVLFAALSVVLLTATVYTYDRLSAETLIAELRFDAAGERQYAATSPCSATSGVSTPSF